LDFATAATGFGWGLAASLACGLDVFLTGVLWPAGAGFLVADGFFVAGLAADLREAAGRAEPRDAAVFALLLPVDLGCALRAVVEGFLAMVILDRRGPA
jgi:hypothetical protein